jgi:single-stranded DNA-binding protein
MVLPLINFEGRVATDPVQRFTKTGAPIVTFRGVAADVKMVNGEWQESGSLWVNFSWYGEQPAWLVKGSRFHAYGKLETREYTTTAGEKRQTVELKTRFISENSITFETKQAQPAQTDVWGTPPVQPIEVDNAPF